MTIPMTQSTDQATQGRAGMARSAMGTLAGLFSILGVGLPSVAAPASATPSSRTIATTVSTDEVDGLARLRADGMLAEPADLSDTGTGRVPAIATQFGLAFFTGMVQANTSTGLQFALAHLGFTPARKARRSSRSARRSTSSTPRSRPSAVRLRRCSRGRTAPTSTTRTPRRDRRQRAGCRSRYRVG